jgi:hypothetical protein
MLLRLTVGLRPPEACPIEDFASKFKALWCAQDAPALKHPWLSLIRIPYFPIAAG